ncbi:saccharopine dehydrogenase NADP-binding domain-containing protein [Acaryochloris sp. IP29b_bin.148]|uniref:saccharopine dehydrogenase family protein n=1 Tax=Acaryochloris sp. IP29b_bin.148 TaxID=2969218 RepID=UPI00263931F9|nr:saccharopine dehydrogenase NADP-binding domain-containing protein [Acaryochloris sp. IP29b_bin.148]
MTNPRPYHVVLYGASGFTGQQTAQYFADRVDREQVRWAIAGRNRQKLERVKQTLAIPVDILVADSQDQEGLDAIAEQTQVILNTAGPFALYGDGIVDACVRKQTHYVDITGETPWVKSLIQRYHAKAAAEGTRIIPFCGFDSVPSDLGTYLLVRYMQQELGVSCRQVKAYFQASGGLNGGTLASVTHLIKSGQSSQMADLFLLNPEDTTQRLSQHCQDPQWPQYDSDLGAWIAPFFMGPVNTRVVRRSSALYDQWQDSYGSNFVYQEYVKAEGPWASLVAVGITLGTGLLGLALSQSWVWSVLQSRFPRPGEGPSAQVMDEGWFRCELLGVAEDGRIVHGLIQNQGDPGNRSTVKFLCESALCLALQAEQLPGQHRGGVLTPATGLGDVLAHRLQQAGTIIQLSSHNIEN